MYQSTYFSAEFSQGIIKNPRIKKIQQVHQKLEAKQYSLFCLTCFHFLHHLDLKQFGFSGEPMT